MAPYLLRTSVTLSLIATTLEIVATLLLTIGLLMVHGKMLEDRAIDEPVIKTFHKEAIMAYTALAILVVAFVISIVDDVLTLSDLSDL